MLNITWEDSETDIKDTEILKFLNKTCDKQNTIVS